MEISSVLWDSGDSRAKFPPNLSLHHSHSASDTVGIATTANPETFGDSGVGYRVMDVG